VTRPFALLTDDDPNEVRWPGRRVEVADLDDARFELGEVTVSALVTSSEAATRVLQAAQRGANLVLRVRLAPEPRAAFVDELGRVADVRQTLPSPLNGEQRALLGYLSSGLSLGQIARRMNFSRRTVDRRLGEIKAVLNVRSATEAVIALDDQQ
jgi:DNA-binding NarL/FixJ family response regulator